MVASTTRPAPIDRRLCWSSDGVWVGSAVADTYHLLLAFLGAAVLAAAVLPRLVHQRPISVPIVFMVAGTTAGFALNAVDRRDENGWRRVAATE